LEVTVNVQALHELKRVLANVPVREFNIANWHYCACGHARRDTWFQSQGVTTCYSFVDAAAFSARLFCGSGLLVSPNAVIKRIDALLGAHEAAEQATRHSRRQAVVNDLLKNANRAGALSSMPPNAARVGGWSTKPEPMQVPIFHQSTKPRREADGEPTVPRPPSAAFPSMTLERARRLLS
jgi:hypothetical protein